MRVRIGVSEGGREIELDIDDFDAFAADVEEAFSSSARLFWVTDTKNHRVGVPVDKIAFIDVEATAPKVSVGFG